MASYVRNGLVIDLEIASGKIDAFVRGTSMYEVAVNIAAVPQARWRSICQESAGAIDSIVELLQGRFSKAVIDRLCRQNSGLFPSPREIKFSCSCPDWASMCKHVADAAGSAKSEKRRRPRQTGATPARKQKVRAARGAVRKKKAR